MSSHSSLLCLESSVAYHQLMKHCVDIPSLVSVIVFVSEQDLEILCGGDITEIERKTVLSQVVKVVQYCICMQCKTA